MNNQDFHELLIRRLQRTVYCLNSKNVEYGAETDKLYNFRRTAEIKRETMPVACWGMATKHLTSVIDMVEGKLAITQHNIDEKIGDMINYLILLEAIFTEQLCRTQMAPTDLTNKPKGVAKHGRTKKDSRN